MFSYHFTAPSGPPETVGAVPLNSSTLQITWMPPDAEIRNGIVRQYIINVTELISGKTTMLQTNQTQAMFSGLHPHYYYSYAVAAETVAVGPWSELSLIQMPEDGMKFHNSINFATCSIYRQSFLLSNHFTNTICFFSLQYLQIAL